MAHFLRGVCLCSFRLRLFSDTQFFRLHLKHSIVAVQRVELTFQNVLIGFLFLLKPLDFLNPAVDNGFRITAAVNKVLDALDKRKEAKAQTAVK